MEPQPTVPELYKKYLRLNTARINTESLTSVAAGVFMGFNADNIANWRNGPEIDFIPLAVAGIGFALNIVYSTKEVDAYKNYYEQAKNEGLISTQKVDEADELLAQSKRKRFQVDLVNIVARMSEGTAAGIAIENLSQERFAGNFTFTVAAAASILFEVTKSRLVEQRKNMLKKAKNLYEKANKLMAAHICELTIKQ